MLPAGRPVEPSCSYQYQMVSATASGKGDWKWLAGAAPISGNGAAPPKGKSSLSKQGPTGWQGSKPRHRNGPFDWVTIHTPIWIAGATAGLPRGALTFVVRSRSVAVFQAKIQIPSGG